MTVSKTFIAQPGPRKNLIGPIPGILTASSKQKTMLKIRLIISSEALKRVHDGPWNKQALYPEQSSGSNSHSPSHAMKAVLSKITPMTKFDRNSDFAKSLSLNRNLATVLYSFFEEDNLLSSADSSVLVCSSFCAEGRRSGALVASEIGSGATLLPSGAIPGNCISGSSSVAWAFSASSSACLVAMTTRKSCRTNIVPIMMSSTKKIQCQ